MKFFVDSADLDAIAELNDIGLVDGVTTNPSIIAKSGRDFKEVIKEICNITDGHVSGEVVAMEADKMIEEGRELRKIASNVCVKLPLTMDPNQALLAAKCGATYISPFIGRLDDLSLDGMELIEDIRTIYDNYGFETEILAASIRNANHVKECAIVGADVMTAPPNVKLPLTLLKP